MRTAVADWQGTVESSWRAIRTGSHGCRGICAWQSRSRASRRAKTWELGAATSLARLCAEQSKRQKAYNVLAPLYGWCTEGFDIADLQEANALLGELQ
jgi:predicted ATPase